MTIFSTQGTQGASIEATHAPAKMLVGFMLATSLGTASATSIPIDFAHPYRAQSQTTAGAGAVETDRITRNAEALGRLRRRSGLTWEQLSRLFRVSRRALHMWATGQQMAPQNEEHLHRMVAVIESADQGGATGNRAALFEATGDGRVAFDLLAAGNYEAALHALGRVERVSERAPMMVTESVRHSRLPPPPHLLVGVQRDVVHRDPGKTRRARSVKVRGVG